jgi:hypothetical protein
VGSVSNLGLRFLDLTATTEELREGLLRFLTSTSITTLGCSQEIFPHINSAWTKKPRPHSKPPPASHKATFFRTALNYFVYVWKSNWAVVERTNKNDKAAALSFFDYRRAPITCAAPPGSLGSHHAAP